MIVERILARRAGLPATPEHDSTTAPVLRKAAPPWLWVEASGVLYDDTCWWRWLAQLLSHTGVYTRYDALLQTWEWEVARDPQGCDFWTALHRCLEQLGVPKGCRDEVQAAAFARQKRLDHSLLPFYGVATTLAELAASGVCLVALSGAGCRTSRLVERLQSLALAEPFRRFISAEDWHRSLVQPRFYRETLDYLGLRPCDVALVTSKHWHLGPASEAGLATIAVDCPPHVRADIHLDFFATLRREDRAPGRTRAA